MRELRSYRDPYHGYKRSQAFFGPYTSPSKALRRLGIAYLVILVVLYFLGVFA